MGEVLEHKPVHLVRHGITIKSEADLNRLSAAQLVETHNRYSEKKTERFSDRKAGVRRTWAALQAFVDGGGAFDLGHFEPSEEELAKQKPRQEIQEAKKPLELDEPPAPPKPKKADKGEGETRGRPRGFSFRFPLGRDGAKPPKEGSKRFAVLQLLLKPKGATFEEVQDASGWKRTDAYEGIRLLHFANGYRLWQTEDGRIHASGEKA